MTDTRSTPERRLFDVAFIRAIDRQAEMVTHTPGWKSLLELVWEELNAERLIARSESAPIPEGWKLVPKEATVEMLAAAGHACDGKNLSDLNTIGKSQMKALLRWNAMLTAAPEAEMTLAVEFHVEINERGKARLRVKCERHHTGYCETPLWSGPASKPMWHWDGNVERPTISPSIDCQGGCGRHFTITEGVVG